MRENHRCGKRCAMVKAAENSEVIGIRKRWEGIFFSFQENIVLSQNNLQKVYKYIVSHKLIRLNAIQKLLLLTESCLPSDCNIFFVYVNALPSFTYTLKEKIKMAHRSLGFNPFRRLSRPRTFLIPLSPSTRSCMEKFNVMSPSEYVFYIASKVN